MTADDFNYDSFLDILNIIEDNVLCPSCKKRYLVSISFKDFIFMCPNCGKHYYIDLVEY